MQSSSLIKKKYYLNNIQILSEYELQNKLDAVLKLIQPNDILSDLDFFKDMFKSFQTSNLDNVFISYKFTLFCYISINRKEAIFFENLFLKYCKLFSERKHKYYSFVLIKIAINNIFGNRNAQLSVDEFNKKINDLLEEYKNNTYNSIINVNINNFIKNKIYIKLFFRFLECFKFPFNKDQINALSQLIANNLNLIVEIIIIDQSSKISYFKKINSIIQLHINNIYQIVTNNNSKKKSKIYMSDFFKSIIIIYNEIIKLFEMNLYDFYNRDFIIDYIHKNLVVTIMQFLEKKFFIIDDKIISKVIELADNIEKYLINNFKINEKKDFIEYSWIMAQFFTFLYDCDDKTQGIIYGNKLINLYKQKSFISRAVILIKLRLYEYFLKNQNDNYSKYDIKEHLNNITELIIMFGKCDIEDITSENYLVKMINHFFKLLTEHIIHIVNNRQTQVKYIYNILLSIHPFVIKCRDNSNNKEIISKINLFNIYCSLINIITPNQKNNKEFQKNEFLIFLNNKNLTNEEKDLFINIISIFPIFTKDYHHNILELLNSLYGLEEYKYFLEVYFNIFYQLQKIEKYNTILLFDLLNLLNNFMKEKLFINNKNNYNDIIFKFQNNYYQIYTVYVYNSIKNAYQSIINNKEKDKNNNDIDSNGILIKLSNSINLLIKFIEIQEKINETLCKMEENTNSYSNKSIFYLYYNIIIKYFFELIDYSYEIGSKNIAFLYQQLYLIATNENMFSSLSVHIQIFIYYILYRLIHNVNYIMNNRDLLLIKGNNIASKTIKTVIYENIQLIKDEKRKNKQNDSFFYLEPLLSYSTNNNNISKYKESIYNDFKNKLILNAKENSINKYVNFKINFVMDTNNLIEIIKIYYLSGDLIDKTYMQSYFDYYIPILNNEKEFSNNFLFILNIFYIIKRIFSLPKTENQNEKIDFALLSDTIRKKEKSFITKKNIIVRLLIKYFHVTKDQNNTKKKKDLLSTLKDDLDKLKQEQSLTDTEQKNQRYLTYIELLSFEFFIKIFNGNLTDDNIDDLLFQGKSLLIKYLELCRAFLNDKYIVQYLPNEKRRAKEIIDFFFEEINNIDLIYLLNLDDYEFVFLQLLDKVYILSNFLFKKMFTYGYGDSLIELFHKLKNFSVLKYNKIYFLNYITYLIKIIRKWKRKEKYDINLDICDFKNYSQYNNFISLLFFNYTKEKYPHLFNNENDCIENKNFNIIEFINKNNIIDDPLLNKCLELNNINSSFNDKEKSIFFKNQIKVLKNNNLNSNEKLNELKNIFLKTFNISYSIQSYYHASFININKKYIIKIIPRLFENEIINNIIKEDGIINQMINTFKSVFEYFKLDKWQQYNDIKYLKKNLRNLIFISPTTEKNETTIKLINLYIAYYHNFKYNLLYKGNENYEKKEEKSIDYLESINNKLVNDDDKIIEIQKEEEEDKNISYMDQIDNKFKSINIMSIFRIRNYLYFYIKVKEKHSYDKIDIQKQKNFEALFNHMKNIVAKEKSDKKLIKSKKNEEYRNSLFELQNLLLEFCPNFMKILKEYYNSHINFNNYINTKIKKYSLKIAGNQIINWLFEQNNEQIKNSSFPQFNSNINRRIIMSIDNYKKKFINRIFNSNNFKFSFYENDINDLFYYIPSIELSKIPLENIPLLYNLAIIRSLNINYIKLNPIKTNISITKDIFCLLNPKKDLIDTEKRIFPIIENNNIQCIKSREPTEKEMNMILNDKKIYIYCGHGDSLKYLKKEYIETHKINFLTFLFGCNSANSRLLSGKDTQPLSTPQLFLKQLCPFFFGFLWTVSSTDLDELTIKLLESILKKENSFSLIKRILLLKRKIGLKWFNGGALVMYSNSDILLEFED